MSYGVALRNGVPFTLGTIAALCVNATTQWNPRSLWPDGIATPGMWISPRDLTSQWQDYQGTTPVVTPGTVADSANPVGLALDIRAGATTVSDPGNHMLQATSAARPLLSAYDGQTLGPGDTYPSTGFPIYQKYDGTDDALASATFPAGTLTSSMDCLIAVRRDSAAALILGLYDSSVANRWLGLPQSGSGAICYDNAGTPTTWVDGVQLAGGTSTTRDTLNTALTVGAFHILEFQGLNLSAWVNAAYGGFTGFQFNGAIGGIQLFASGQDANRTKARAAMAAYFGVTLA